MFRGGPVQKTFPSSLFSHWFGLSGSVTYSFSNIYYEMVYIEILRGFLDKYEQNVCV